MFIRMGTEVMAFFDNAFDDGFEFRIVEELTGEEEGGFCVMFIKDAEDMVATLGKATSGEDQGKILFRGRTS